VGVLSTMRSMFCMPPASSSVLRVRSSLASSSMSMARRSRCIRSRAVQMAASDGSTNHSAFTPLVSASGMIRAGSMIAAPRTPALASLTAAPLPALQSHGHSACARASRRRSTRTCHSSLILPFTFRRERSEARSPARAVQTCPAARRLASLLTGTPRRAGKCHFNTSNPTTQTQGFVSQPNPRSALMESHIFANLDRHPQ